MNDKFQGVLFGIAAFILGIIAFTLGRGFNRAGIPGDNDSVRPDRTSIDEQRAVNTELGKNNGVIKSTITEVRINNYTAREAIQRARKILQAAADRNKNPTD